MRIGLIGLGAIGRLLLACLRDARCGVEVLGAVVARPEAHGDRDCRILRTLDELLAAGPDLVVECASQRALREYGPTVLGAGFDLLASSVGALADEATHRDVDEAAARAGSRLIVASGALVGIDGLVAARHVGLSAVRYERRAPPATWIRSGALDAALADREGPFELFSGTAREAALRYPKNANVAATIALAGLGFDATEVVLLVDPARNANTHVIRARGAFGESTAEIAAATIDPEGGSSRIVAGSLARAIVAHTARIVV